MGSRERDELVNAHWLTRKDGERIITCGAGACHLRRQVTISNADLDAGLTILQDSIATGS